MEHRIPANLIERAAVVAAWRAQLDPLRAILMAVVGEMIDELRRRPTPIELARWADDGGARP